MAVAQNSSETVDPRIRRTRRLLQDSLEKLLKEKDLDSISVQDIADTATVNRATFYDHYPGKSELLQCLVASRFAELLARRQVQFDASCGSSLNAIALAVCDYLIATQGTACRKQAEPKMESAIISVVRQTILEGLRAHGSAGDPISAETVASTVSWGMYGAVKEWAEMADRPPASTVAETVGHLLLPVVQSAQLICDTERD